MAEGCIAVETLVKFISFCWKLKRRAVESVEGATFWGTVVREL